jgi:hypothetical protein
MTEIDSPVRRRAVLAGIGVALSGCVGGNEQAEQTPPADDDREPLSGSWPMFARDAANTGYVPEIEGP